MKINQKILFGLPILLLLHFPLLSAVSEEQEALLKKLPPDQRSAIMGKMEESNDLNKDIEEAFSKDGFLIERPDKKDEDRCEECIYGYDLFKFSPSTFAPANVIPVSSTYALGPGDKLKVSLYGSEEANADGFISRDGTLLIPMIGTVSLAGLTFSEARDFLEAKVNKELPGTKISISLTELRSITVYVLGESYQPGSYTLSALSTVTNALFLSGGVNKQGSLRNIQVKRGKGIAKTYDLYDLLLKGDNSTDLRLEDGDTIFVPFIQNKITLGGSFKRPYIYEFLEGETLEDAVSFAGGFKSEVSLVPNLEYSTINRILNKREVLRLPYNAENKTKYIIDGDAINVSENSGLKPRSIELVGEFNYPGVYSINEGDTVFDIISRAGGYTNSAFTEGAIFLRKGVAKRQKEGFNRSADNLEELIVRLVSDASSTPGSPQIGQFSLAPFSTLIKRLRDIEPVGRFVANLDMLELKTNPYSNFELRDGDKLIVSRRPDTVSIVGEVLNSTSIIFHPESSLNDYLDNAGGLNFQADKDKIYIISPNGEAVLYKRKFLRNSNIDLIPGSTIVVSRDTRAWDAVKLTQIITPILADLATSAAAIAAIQR